MVPTRVVICFSTTAIKNPKSRTAEPMTNKSIQVATWLLAVASHFAFLNLSYGDEWKDQAITLAQPPGRTHHRYTK